MSLHVLLILISLIEHAINHQTSDPVPFKVSLGRHRWLAGEFRVEEDNARTTVGGP